MLRGCVRCAMVVMGNGPMEGPNMKDDPREVDWAPRKIKGLMRHFEILEGRVHRLEGQTQFETSEDNDRIEAMEAAVRELQSAVASIRTQQDFMINAGHGESFEVWCRRKINGLFSEVQRVEDKLDSHLEWAAERSYSHDYAEGDGSSFIEDHSMPNGTAVAGMDNYMGAQKTVETAEQLDERRRVLVESMKDRRITFDPEPSTIFEPKDTESGPPAGWVQAQDGSWLPPYRWILSQAEVRVRDYMANHFSTATIEGVVRAVRNEPEAVGDLGPKSRQDANEHEAARVVGTKCPGSPKCWAMDRLHWHDAHGVVNTKNR